MGLDRFVIEASEVESMAKDSSLSVLQLLPSLVSSTQKLARPPISSYHVGAVGLGSSGRIFLGVNLEFPGLPLHHSVHAEQFLITNAAINGETKITNIAVSDAPCGHCRQFMQEMRGVKEMKILITAIEHEEDQDRIYRPISYFLPQRFGPHNLLDESVPLLLEPRNNGLAFNVDVDVVCNGNSGSSGVVCNGNDEMLEEKLKNAAVLEAADNSHTDEKLEEKLKNAGSKAANNSHVDEMMLEDKLKNAVLEVADNSHADEMMLEEKLKNAALEAANNSHAPYSDCPAGVALVDCDGGIHKGMYIESAAYNPSLGPVQAALIAYIAGGGGGYEKIVGGVLVEKEGMMVRQEDTARLLLKAVNPKCDFRVFNCTAVGMGRKTG